mmetsp:Transcript_23204/g.45049  ORF Transcript_23204/g.45049 Transcript_23204/m.45049 type:complete len:96 (-) Transcript_23204:68-355(-)
MGYLWISEIWQTTCEKFARAVAVYFGKGVAMARGEKTCHDHTVEMDAHRGFRGPTPGDLPAATVVVTMLLLLGPSAATVVTCGFCSTGNNCVVGY